MAKPIQFQEANMVWKGWPADTERTEVLDLPAHRSGDQTISCWKLSWLERLNVLFRGVAWVYVYGQCPPVAVGGIKPFTKYRSAQNAAVQKAVQKANA